jgi:hypothetical protein
MDPRTAAAVEGERRKGVAAHTNDTTGSTPSAASALWSLAGGSGGPVKTGDDTEASLTPCAHPL